MSNTQRRLWWLVLAFAGLVAVVVSLLGYLFLAPDPNQAGTVIAAVVAVLASATGLTSWLWRRYQIKPALPDLDHVADVLAVAVRVRWHQIAVDRTLLYPAPIPVQWRWSDRPVSSPRTEAVGAGGFTARMLPLPGMSQVGPARVVSGGLADLLEIYGGLDSGRIVLMGGPGAGKSSAAIMLLLDALAHRAGLTNPAERARTPVPVLLTFYGWNPAEQPLAAWAASRLASDYGSAGINTSVAKALVTGGKIALLLDGLDELPADLRPVALRALQEQTTGRLVLLTRTQELADAVTGGHLPGAAPLELQLVTAKQAADYLGRCQIHPLPQPWRQLIDCLRSDAKHPVTQALDTPLMLSLIRDTYPTSDQLDDLLAPGRYTTRTQVEDHLLDRVLPAAYTRRPGQPALRYTLDQAQNWLSYIAEQMIKRQTRDLAWWQIPTWRPRAFRIIATFVLAMPAIWLVCWPVIWLAFWFVDVPTAPGLAFLLGLVPALLLGLLVTSTSGRAREPQEWGRFRWMALLSRAFIARWLTVSLTIGIMYGLAAGFFTRYEAGSMAGLPIGLATGLMGMLGSGLVSALEIAAVRTAGDPLDPVDPLTCWRHDQRVNVTGGIVFGLAQGTIIAFWTGLWVWYEAGIAAGLVVWLAVWLAGGIVLGFVSSSDASTWSAAMTFVQIRLAGHGPLRMMRFLEDAHNRHVLRAAGPVFQFRHARLQDRLQAIGRRPR